MPSSALPRAGLALLVVWIVSASADAGMPAPLPADYEQVWRLTDSAHGRLEAISFFAVGLLITAGVVQFLWNYVRRAFAGLPRLTYPRALCVVLLWGLLSFVVLTMISGARELMTPGAWRKQGFTYRLANEAPTQTNPSRLEERRRKLEDLRAALWHFAALHAGRFPTGREELPGDPSLWSVAGGRLPYVYVPGLRPETTARLLAAEPELAADERWILLTSGEIRLAASVEIEKLLRPDAVERQP